MQHYAGFISAESLYMCRRASFLMLLMMGA